MELFYSIQELVELQSSMQNSNYPNNRQGFEYRAKKENWREYATEIEQLASKYNIDKVVRVLLVYNKGHVGKKADETAWWRRVIKHEYK